MIFVYLMTTTITSVWIFRSFQNKRFEFAHTPLDLPLLLFLLSQIISTIISIDPHTSLWGYYSRFHGGLMSTISYTLLFYAFVTHFQNDHKAVKNVINTILATAALTAFYGVLEHFGIDKHVWVQDVQNRVFSTLGQPNWLSAYLISIVPISLHLFLRASQASPLPKYIYGFLTLLFLITITYTKSQSGLAATAIVLLISLFIYAKQFNKQKYLLLLIPIALILFFIPRTATSQEDNPLGGNNYALRTLHSLNNINPLYSNSLAIAKKEHETRTGGSDSMIIRRVVWDGAIKLGLAHPFFGTGVETFGYSYYWKRPLAHNYTSETDFLYNKAHNEYLNFFANTGFLGLLSYLFLIFSILKIFSKSHNAPSTNHLALKIPLTLGFLSILITNFFGFSVVNVGLFFFLFPAIYISTTNALRTNHLALTTIDPTLPLIILSISTLFSLNYIKNLWSADLAYVRGRNNLEENLKAVKLNPKEPLYYSQLGYIQALIASQVIAPKLAETATASAETNQKITGYLDTYSKQAIENSQKAVQMNPYHLNLYKSQARTLVTLGTIDQKYFQAAIISLLKITELSPTDPANYYNLGVLHQNLKNNEAAKQSFQKALEVFPQHAASQAQLDLLQKNPPK